MPVADAYPHWAGGRVADEYWREHYHFLASKGFTLRDYLIPDDRPWPPRTVSTYWPLRPQASHPLFNYASSIVLDSKLIE